jgi:hypothetical protein
MRPIKLMVASCTFSCRFLKIGVIRGTEEENDLDKNFALRLISRLTKILDRWIHLRHTHHVRDGALRSDDATECVGVLFTQLLKQHQSELVEELILTALLDDDGETRSEIGGLLTNFGALIIETPEDRGDNLCKIGFDADT